MPNDLLIPESQNASGLSGLHVIDFAPQRNVPSTFLDGVQNTIYKIDNGKHNRSGDEIHTQGSFSLETAPRSGVLGAFDVLRQIDLESYVPPDPGVGAFLYVTYEPTGLLYFGGVLTGNGTVSASSRFTDFFTIGSDKITCIQPCSVLVQYSARVEGNSGSGPQDWSVKTEVLVSNYVVSHDFNYCYGSSGAARKWREAWSVIPLVLNLGDQLTFRQTNGGGSAQTRGQTLNVTVVAVPVDIGVAPTAVLQAAANTAPGIRTELDGTGSFDSTGATLTPIWTLDSKPVGSTVNLENNTLLNYFTPDVAGTYVITLMVSNGTSLSVPVTKTIVSVGSGIGFIITTGGTLLGDSATLAHEQTLWSSGGFSFDAALSRESFTGTQNGYGQDAYDYTYDPPAPPKMKVKIDSTTYSVESFSYDISTVVVSESSPPNTQYAISTTETSVVKVQLVGHPDLSSLLWVGKTVYWVD